MTENNVETSLNQFIITMIVYNISRQMSRPARKPTVWPLRNVSTQISLSMTCRLTRTKTFRLLWIFCFRNHYSIPLPPWDGMCRLGSVRAYYAGWSGSIHYKKAIMLVFSWDGSLMKIIFLKHIRDRDVKGKMVQSRTYTFWSTKCPYQN